LSRKRPWNDRAYQLARQSPFEGRTALERQDCGGRRQASVLTSNGQPIAMWPFCARKLPGHHETRGEPVIASAGMRHGRLPAAAGPRQAASPIRTTPTSPCMERRRRVPSLGIALVTRPSAARRLALPVPASERRRERCHSALSWGRSVGTATARSLFMRLPFASTSRRSTPTTVPAAIPPSR